MAIGLPARIAEAARSGPLGHRGFRFLIVGQMTSTAGDYVYSIALPWLVLSGHGSPQLLGAVLTCYGVPRVVCIPLGGIIADRVSPRMVMLTSDAARCGLAAIMAWLALRHIVDLRALGVVAAGLGAGEGLFLPSSFSIMPTLLTPDQLQAGNALNEATASVGSLVGPAVGGALVSAAGSFAGLVLDAASFAISSVSLAFCVQPTPITDPTPAASAADKDGVPEASSELPEDRAPGVIGLILSSRLLLVMFVVTVAANLVSGGAFEVALPELAHSRYGAAGYGALVACIGAGSVAGPLVAILSGRLRRPAVAAMTSFLGAAAAVAAIPLTGLAGTAALVLIFGAALGFGNVTMLTLMQRAVPGPVLGRTMSAFMVASLGSFPVSVAVAGYLVKNIGTAPFFWASGAVMATAILGALSQRVVRQLGTADSAQPQQRSTQPDNGAARLGP